MIIKTKVYFVIQLQQKKKEKKVDFLILLSSHYF